VIPTHPYLHGWDPGRYSPAYLRSGVTEAQVQMTGIAYLWHRKVWAFSVDVGAKALQGRAFGALRRVGLDTAVLAGRTGAGNQGVSDIIGVLDGRALFIEMKAPEHRVPSLKRPGKTILKRSAGLPTEAQLRFLDDAYRAGAIVGVAWSVTDIGDILDFYLEQEDV
jgi:hypothetical protein